MLGEFGVVEEKEEEAGQQEVRYVPRTSGADTSGSLNVSYGSMEAIGGPAGCYSREIEYETRLSEICFQLAQANEKVNNLQQVIQLQILNYSQNYNPNRLFLNEVITNCCSNCKMTK